jgi:molybdopterin-binding protein
MISARNQMAGQVTAIQRGEVMSLVTMGAENLSIVASVTNQGVKAMGLKVGDSVTALVKFTEAMVIKGESAPLKISARNRF